MPRYYFDIHDDEDFIDGEGIILAGEAEAEAEAVVTAGEMLRERGSKTWCRDAWTMNVRNGDGISVYRFTFVARRCH